MNNNITLMPLFNAPITSGINQRQAPLSTIVRSDMNMIKNLTVTSHNKRSLWLLIPLTLIVLALSQPTSAISYSSTPGQYPTFSSNNGSSSNTSNTSSSGTTSGFSTSGSSTSTPTFSGTGSSNNETNDESSGTTSGFSTTGSTTSHPTFSASGPSDNETNDDSSGTTNGFSTTGTPFSYPTFSATGPTDNETNTEPTGTTYGFSVPPIINNPPTQTETTNNTTSDTTSIPPHNNNQLGSITFYHNDATNSPIAATDELGHVLWTERREPFGEPKLNDSAKAQHRVGYTGHVYDKELGLHYQGRRFYDPIIGRFTSIDPVGFHSENVQSFNRYAYANNNPYRFYDPDGRVPVDTVWDAFNVAYDIGKITVGYTIGDQRLVVEGAKDLAFDFGALLVPYVPAGGTKLAREGAEQVIKKTKLSGKNPPINQNRQKLHTNGTEGKSQFKDGVDADSLVQDAWRNGTPKFNKNGKLIGKVKQYKGEVGAQGQNSVDTRFSRKQGVHGFPSNKKE